MLYPIKVLTLDLGLPIPDIKGLADFKEVQVLVTIHGQPIGYSRLAIHNNEVSGNRLISNILDLHASKIIQHLIRFGLENPVINGKLEIENLLSFKPYEPCVNWPKITVAVCTRNRPEQLIKCLESIGHLDYSFLDVVVIDNAPDSTATEDLVKSKFVGFRYFKEETPGLNWARNRAILESKGEIVAYVDDDVIVDKNWAKSLGRMFALHPEVMAITGLVAPAELETKAQVMFEAYGGFGKGFERKWHRISGNIVPWQLLGAGQFGTGANMAFRKTVFHEIGLFDPSLDVGTPTNGGGDLELFFRVIKHGHTLVYEPSAIVLHFHRKTYPELKYQIANNSKGFVAYLVRSNLNYPDQFIGYLRIWLWYCWFLAIIPLLRNFLRPSNIPNNLLVGELKGCFSFGLYAKAKKITDKSDLSTNEQFIAKSNAKEGSFNESEKKIGTAIRLIDLSSPVHSLTDIGQYPKTRIFFKWHDYFFGHLNVANHYTPLHSDRIIEMVTREFSLKLLNPSPKMALRDIREQALINLRNNFELSLDQEIPEHPEISPSTVSIVIATFDRPTDLYECLTSLRHQKTIHRLEVIVVDNHPSSGLTPPVVAQFQDVILISEVRKGLSYARNAGIIASSGEFILSTDDDVIIPENWVDNLLRPFSRADVMVVTGNVLPLTLENEAQHHFEMYGGLGKGYEQKEYGRRWFGSFKKYAVPTWNIGACANAAFRSGIFINKNIGLLEEVLGPGMPSGVGEDTYLFYKVLKQEFTIIYEPKAYVWHKHRKTNKAFRKQLYNYSKGHVSYHIVTGINDRDIRGLFTLTYALPKYHLFRVIRAVVGRNDFPLNLILVEIAGNLIGPFALLLSWLKVKRLGRSQPKKVFKQEIKNPCRESIIDLKRESI
jgi:O-antigen biosynthesis protein